LKTTLKIIAAVLVADYLFAKINTSPNIIIKQRLKGGYNAKTIPPFGIYIAKGNETNATLLKHELAHWEQYRKTGAIIFFLKYLTQKALYGYDNMPIEIEARKITGEKNECLTNYTSCVRQGTAITVQNISFRK
jgi:hypothetical protein